MGHTDSAALADADCRISDIGKRYFDLGWDFASYSNIALPGGAPPEMQQGWKEGRSRLKPREATRYDRKWLALRFNALARNRVVDSVITPDYLRAIAPRCCPVMGVPMTYATGGDLDWSVDRVCNRGGYADGNLVMMATIANKAKSTHNLQTVHEIAKLAAERGGPLNGLTYQQWMRMAALMIGPDSIARGVAVLLPQTTPLPPGVAAIAHQFIQEAILLGSLDKRRVSVLGKLRARCTKASERKLHKVIQALKHKGRRNHWVYDTWLETGVFPRFVDWYSDLSPEDSEALREIAATREFRRSERLEDSDIERWSLETAGYCKTPGKAVE